MKFFVSCAKGLEYLLVDELLALGVDHATATVAGVNAEGELHQAQHCVLWSRLASRVLWPITHFDCPDANALYDNVRAIDWQQHLQTTHTFAVDAHVSGTAITHAQYAAQRIKDAVVDYFRAEGLERPSVDVEAPEVRINFSLRKGHGTISIDLGGGSLHRRGWRQAQNAAPLKENLAAALLIRAQWPQKYAEGGGLLDPMCGSGTLLIEGALMAADSAPGLQRHGSRSPTQWLGWDKTHWQTLITEAKQRQENGFAALKPVIWGSDIHPHAIETARQNAEMAGVANYIQWDVFPVNALTPPPLANGSVVCNAPYDARLAADPLLYQQLGQALQRSVPQWRAALLCGNQDLAYATGLRAHKKYQWFNGALECFLVVCDPVGEPRVRTQSGAGASSTNNPIAIKPRELSEGAQMVANRLRKNIRKLKTWRQRDNITCYRVYDADLPEYSAAIDVYQDADNAELWLHVQEYAAPATIDENNAQRRFDELVAAVEVVFEVPRERVAIKSRRKGKGGSKYGRLAERQSILWVNELNARLKVNLFDYLDTGLFLDHRPLRSRIAQQSSNKRVLNLFSYTGVATVHAALGGASRTTSVDLSATYLQWCADNLMVNGFGGQAHKLVQADVVSWLEAERELFDIIFCDPPTFSNSARADDFDIQRDHIRLLTAAVARLAPGGLMYFSNNFRRFKLDENALAQFAHYEEITPSTIAPDFERNAKIHRCWQIWR